MGRDRMRAQRCSPAHQLREHQGMLQSSLSLHRMDDFVPVSEGFDNLHVCAFQSHIDSCQSVRELSVQSEWEFAISRNAGGASKLVQEHLCWLILPTGRSP